VHRVRPVVQREALVLVRVRASSRLIALLQHGHALALLGEECTRRQSRHTSANNDRVGLHRPFLSSGVSFGARNCIATSAGFFPNDSSTIARTQSSYTAPGVPGTICVPAFPRTKRTVRLSARYSRAHPSQPSMCPETPRAASSDSSPS